ncbi:[FeFe] hydrogenase H-cluster radical SAM maturase HydE [Clostridium sp. CTA-19]
MAIKKLLDKLYSTNNLNEEELLYLLNNLDEEGINYLTELAHKTAIHNYNNSVYIRGLIEFTNYCSRNCIYCGIRACNKNAQRYRLTKDEILECVEKGDKLGYKTFVLQGGEDPYFTDEKIIDIVQSIKKKCPDCAVTLSIGERSYKSYKDIKKAGVDRYLLRHETANKNLYESLHPNSSFENRVQCLLNLKELGYQIGAGFMVGIPGQTNEDLVKDLLFIKKLTPHMCGIGPFIPHKDTIFKDEKSGTTKKTIIMLALTRLLVPKVLLPATTALGTIDSNGREKGIKAGANVVMPNLSPNKVREKYALYNGKVSSGDEAAECKKEIEDRINSIGFKVEISRGDSKVL